MFRKNVLFALLVLVVIVVACATPTEAPKPTVPPPAPTSAPAAQPTVPPVPATAVPATVPPTAVPKPTEDPLKGLTDAQKAWAKAAEVGPFAPAKQDWAAIEAAAKKEGKVAIYSTCYINYNEPGIGHDLTKILAHNEIPYVIVLSASVISSLTVLIPYF